MTATPAIRPWTKPPFTSGPLDPCQTFGRPVILLGASGAPFPKVYGVSSFERIPLLGQGGFIPLMIPSGGVLAGYRAYGGEGVFPLTAGGVSGAIQPNALQLSPLTLLQCRILLRGIGTIPADLAIDDIDLAVYYPGAVQHWQLQNAGGVINAIGQAPMPADATVGPSQGSDMTVPSAFPGLLDAFTAAYASEFFIWGQTQPSFQLINHGSVSIGADASYMLGLNLTAIRYDLIAWEGDSSQNVNWNFGGNTIQAPADSVVIPNSAFPPLARGGGQ